MGGGGGEMCDYCFTCDSPGEDCRLEPLDAPLDLRKTWVGVGVGMCDCHFTCDSPGEDCPLEPLDAALDLRKAWVGVGVRCVTIVSHVTLQVRTAH